MYTNTIARFSGKNEHLYTNDRYIIWISIAPCRIKLSLRIPVELRTILWELSEAKTLSPQNSFNLLLFLAADRKPEFSRCSLYLQSKRSRFGLSS